MFTRVVSFTGAKDLDAGIAYVRDEVTPVLHQQRGYAGAIASVDRANNVFGILSRWETEADRDASESAMLKAREEGQEIIGGSLSVEYYEEVLLEVVAPAHVGSRLLVTRITSDPARIEENVAYFQREVLPAIKQSPGLLFVRQVVNRQTGDALVGTGWTDDAAMKAAATAAEERQHATADLPVTIVGRSLREVVLLDQP